MSMTKRDYELIARVFRDADDGDGYKHYILLALATTFENENPRFDRARFLKACGLEEIWPGQFSGVSAMAGDNYEATK